MRLRKEPSDSQACSHALSELNTPSVKNATRRRRHGLPDNRLDHEGAQGDDKNDDETELLEQFRVARTLIL